MEKSRKRIAVLVMPEATHLRETCLGIVDHARGRADWQLTGIGYGIGEPFDPTRPPDGTIASLPAHHPLWEAIPDDVPTVWVSTRHDADRQPGVLPDHERIGQLAFSHLSDLGLPHLAYSGEDQPYSVRRERAFVDAAKQCEKSVQTNRHPVIYKPSAAHWSETQSALTTWLADLPRPCGIFACDDRRAAELAVAARDIGFRIPDDLCLLGVNDDQLVCSVTLPPISSIHFDGRAIGRRAAVLLDRMLTEQRPVSPEYLPPTGISQRLSTAWFPVDDTVVARALRRIHLDAPRHPLTVDTLADESPLSRREFLRRFKAALGHSPKQAIDHARATHAAQRLTETDTTITDLATEMGFPTPQAFSRFFKNATGVTPTEHRADPQPIPPP